jgi:osmoprotectant transport system permease protein
MVRNRVLMVLVLAGLAAALGLGFVSHASNRLISGRSMALLSLPQGKATLVLIPALLLAAGPFLPQRRSVHGLVAAAAAALLLSLLWLAGAEATAFAKTAPAVARTSLGAAFWAVLGCAALAMNDALRRLGLRAAGMTLVAVAVVGAVAILVRTGAVDHLSLVQEYAARGGGVVDALLRHCEMVATALLPTVAIGFVLGVRAHRHAALGGVLFPVLSLVQTVPSIALFAILIAPLSALARAFPALGERGLGGVGFLPAVIALFLYGLLPVTRNTAVGLAGVAPAALEAAHGIGMTPRQAFWRVELPLALPVILAGVRVAVVQAIGLAAVAALIGAGGLGAIMFEGLFADALDLVLLGVLPTVLLALAASAAFSVAIARVQRVPR